MKRNSEDKLSIFQLLILLLSLYVIGSLIVSTLFVLSPEEHRLLTFIDNSICGVFFIDFLIRFYVAENKLHFMKWGWIDLISSIPTLDCFRYGRAFRLIRLFRLVRAFRSSKMLIDYIFRKKSYGAFGSAAIIAVLMIVFSSIAILHFEDHPGSNIKTAEDALWWSYCTISTVGFGDRYPVTTEGRIIAIFLMSTGVGLFGTFTGFIASWFVRKDHDEEIEQSEPSIEE
jgi:voltage-gated potassium channel